MIVALLLIQCIALVYLYLKLSFFKDDAQKLKRELIHAQVAHNLKRGLSFRSREFAELAQEISTSIAAQEHAVVIDATKDIPPLPLELSHDEVFRLIINDIIERFSAQGVALIRGNTDDRNITYTNRCGRTSERLISIIKARFSSYFTHGESYYLGWYEHIFDYHLHESLTFFGYRSSFAAPFYPDTALIWVGFSTRKEQVEKKSILEDYLVRMRPRIAEYVERKQLELDCSFEKKQGNERAKLLAYTAHDMRSPLNNIRLILNTLSADKSSNNNDLIAGGIQSCDFLSEIIEDALDYSRYRSGVLHASPENLPCDKIIERVCRSFEQLAQDKKLSLIRNIPPGLIISVDPKQFARILSNIISNAIKYTDHGGVSIVAKSSDDNRLILTVRDSGIGMSREEVEQMFIPYTRFQNDSIEGSGLGLSLVKVFADINKCSIDVESTPDHGTSIILGVPLVSVSKSEDSSLESCTFEKEKTILIVDDHWDAAKSLSRVLKACGYSVTILNTLAEARSYLPYQNVQTLVTDLTFADGEGESLVRYALAHQYVDSIAILSGREVKTEHRDLLAEKKVHYFKKPASISDLLTALNPAGPTAINESTEYDHNLPLIIESTY